jgi:hypothetical protein
MATSLHVTFKLRSGDVGARTVLLRLQRAIVKPVVELRTAHAEDLCRLTDFEAQGGKGGRLVDRLGAYVQA